MAFTVNDIRDLTQILTLHPEWRAEVRRLVLTDELLALPEVVRELAQAQARTEARLEELAQAQARTEARLEELAQAQVRTEARLGELAQAQARSDVRLEELAAVVRALSAEVRGLTRQVHRLTAWQRGESGRREGERYELRIVASAPALFNGGEGGAPGQPLVQQHLTQKLKPVLASRLLADEENPFLADLIWWKGEQYLVVEASLQVNGRDVARAARRAETLQKANLQATGLVIGHEWTGDSIRQLAESSAVQWKVGDDFSEGWLAFRRLAG